MKKFILAVVLAMFTTFVGLSFAGTNSTNYVMVVPQKPGGGTSVWHRL